MKKLLLSIIFLTFISCDKYYKDDFIGIDYTTNKSYYCLRIFENYTCFNNGAVKIYELKESEINEKNIDSLNNEADKFIKLLNKKL